MKTVLGHQTVDIPEHVNRMHSYCEGPHRHPAGGFSHSDVELKGTGAPVDNWWGNGKVQSRTDLIAVDFPSRLRSVCAHFLISVVLQESGPLIEIRRFGGKKYICRVQMRSGVACAVSQAQKVELILKGNDIELVSNSAALIQQAKTVKNGIRKILDGV